MLENIKNSFLQILKDKNGIFVILMMLCGFCISAEYGVIRPACDAIFISTYTTKLIPYAWIISLPINFLIIHLYNKFLPKYGCLKTFLGIVIAVCSINAISAIFIGRIPYMAFFQYMWKDAYILIMFKQMWSLIHSTLNTKDAKYTFGVIFGMGGVGSVVGGLISGFLAVDIGSQNLLFFTLFFYMLIYIIYSFAYKRSGMKNNSYHTNMEKNKQNPGEAFRLIKKSKLLTFVLLIVIFMQISRGFVDFEFSVFLEKNIIDLDLRTQFLGKLVSITNTITSCFQFLGGFLLIHFLGLKRLHLLIPTTLGFNAIGLLVFPFFPIATYSYISIKAIDYSIFGIIREMLYVPMQTDEKFRAKTIIDVFAYRGARAFTSFLIIFISFMDKNISIPLLGFTSIFIFIAWAFIVKKMFKHYELRINNTSRITPSS
jgi:ATP:ADP antiporter, AAA family